jgi:hypothetical protein
MLEESKNESLLRLQKSKERVINSFKKSLNNNEHILNMGKIREMLTEKLKGESLSQEIIQERNRMSY